MRAAVIRDYGPPSVLNVVSNWPRPTRKPGEVLVKIHAAGEDAGLDGSPVLASHQGSVPALLRASSSHSAGLLSASAAINPVDYKTRKGQFPLPSLIGTLPKVRYLLAG